ncbi:MAG: hypothetical protein FJ009_10965 [Chloroflexi bacterium]|nr:hypothetical protein [Chloroflexota bacterium]
MKKTTVAILLGTAGIILCVGFVLCLAAAYFISTKWGEGNIGQSNQQAIIGRWECRSPQASNLYIMYEFFRDGTVTWHQANATGNANGTYTFADNNRMKVVGTVPDPLFFAVFNISISGDYMTLTIEGQTGLVQCDRLK